MTNSTAYIRTYKYRLYPNKTQERALSVAFAIGRHMYNEALAIRKQEWQRSRRTIPWFELRKRFTTLRHEYPDDAGLISASTVNCLMMRLEKSYKAFFKQYRSGTGFPKFKNARTFTNLEWQYTSGLKAYDGHKATIRIFKVGDVKLRYHRPLPENAAIKMVIIKRQGSKWYVCFQIQFESRPLPTDMQDRAVGIDVGIAYLLALSDGQTLDNPRWYRESLAKRRRLNRSLARKKMRSHRWKQVRQQIAKHESAIAQRRWYFWQTVTDRLTRDYSFIAIEDLSPDFMIANKQLALSAHDAGWSTFKQMLEYKCEERSVTLVKVKPAYTSQTCNECGAVDKENRKTQAGFECLSCGHTENADTNAAKNILRKGLQIAGIEHDVLQVVEAT